MTTLKHTLTLTLCENIEYKKTSAIHNNQRKSKRKEGQRVNEKDRNRHSAAHKHCERDRRWSHQCGNCPRKEMCINTLTHTQTEHTHESAATQRQRDKDTNPYNGIRNY